MGQIRKMLESVDTKQARDIEKGSEVAVDVLSKSAGRIIPVRLVLGSDGYG